MFRKASALFEHKEETFVIPDKAAICKHGYMAKRGNLNKSWKKRWCVLDENNTLLYYEHPENTNQTALGQFSLYNVFELKTEDENAKENIFQLVTAKRTFTFKCFNTFQYKAWINIITIKLNPITIYEGWAEKRGELHQSWKKRYFVFIKYKKNDAIYELRYYENDTLKKFKGVIECKWIVQIDTLLPKQSLQKYGKGKDKILEIITPKRTYTMNFKTGDIRNKWKEVLTNNTYCIQKEVLNDKNNNQNEEVKDEFSDEDD